jgi:hypothetical protein
MDLMRIKTLLSLTDNSKDELLAILINNAMHTVCTYIGANELPNELTFVVEELTVVKYRRLGAEGIDTEKIDVLSTKYVVDELNPFKTILDQYIDKKMHGRKLKMI